MFNFVFDSSYSSACCRSWKIITCSRIITIHAASRRLWSCVLLLLLRRLTSPLPFPSPTRFRCGGDPSQRKMMKQAAGRRRTGSGVIMPCLLLAGSAREAPVTVRGTPPMGGIPSRSCTVVTQTLTWIRESSNGEP